ncbi:MAG: choice-of-anchor J domain-containing protein, partial [Thermoanaerobaculia bacterium]|nr:choice-of-anchor J domain-containing protein [Thermoanaerobaculia bacterium]
SAGTASATVTAGSASATSDASGNFTLTGLAAGTYTVTPTKSGCTFSPTSRSVTVSSANVTGVNFTASCGGGETTLFNDGFESTGWSQVDTSGTAGSWTFATSSTYPTTSPHGGTKLAKFNSYNASSGSQTRVYRSSGFAVASSYTSVTLKFWMYHDTGYSSRNDRIQPQVSVNGTTWTNVGSAISRYSGSTGWAQVTIDLSAYKGQTVRLGFLGISAYGNNMTLDDVTVTAQ